MMKIEACAFISSREHIASKNFLNLILAQKKSNNILFIFDYANSHVALILKKCIAEDFPNLNAHFLPLVDINLDQIDLVVKQYDRVIPIYDINPKNSQTIEIEQRKKLRQKIHRYFDKVTRICDLSQDFNDFFSLPHSYFIELHNKIIDAAKDIRTIKITNSFGTNLSAQTNSGFSWVNVNGINPNKIHGTDNFFYEAMLGEVGTYSSQVNGIIQFTGSILFSNNQHWTNQLINQPITLEISNSRIINIQTADKNILTALKNKFAEHEFNSYLAEIGIGTNPAIKLQGKNLIFEERHTGIHIGFGGAKGSDHMDFIFADSAIAFDDKIIFDKYFYLP